jgi:hypothetical protein
MGRRDAPIVREIMRKITLRKEKRFFEFILIAGVMGIAIIGGQLGEHKLIVLNLFFLPIILNAYFLGRTSSCILALLAVLTVTIVASLDPGGLAARYSPLTSGLAIATWAAILGLAAILVGTLCDERAKTVDQLHQAYVGVVEVLSQYLQGGQPTTKSRSTRIAELSQLVAQEMHLPGRDIDDIRVAALLNEIGNVEITTSLITKAVDTIEARPNCGRKHTFAGLDLAQSLGSVLHSAVPLLLTLQTDFQAMPGPDDQFDITESPLGAKIIEMVRAFDQITGAKALDEMVAEHALSEISNQAHTKTDRELFRALQRVVRRSIAAAPAQPCPA